MPLLLFYALLLFITGVRSAIWATGHLNKREWAPGVTFLLLALAWLAASSALTAVAVT